MTPAALSVKLRRDGPCYYNIQHSTRVAPNLATTHVNRRNVRLLIESLV